MIRIIDAASVHPIVRRALAADAAFFPDVERSAARAFENLPGLGWTPGNFVISVEDHLKSIARGTLWVAEKQGRVVGFLTADIAGDELHIAEFNVRLEHQRRGMGRQLIAAAVDFAAENDFAAVTLTTFLTVPWNEPFYASLGFQVLSGTEVGPRLGATLDLEMEHGLPRGKRCAMRMVISR